jgi:hypothetical protein
MFNKLIVFVKKQVIFFFGVIFGVATASVVTGLLASITSTELLDVAKVLDLLDCYEESVNEK